MLIPIHRVKLYPMLFKGESFMLIAIHGLKLYSHCYTCFDTLCSLLYMV